MKSVFERVTLMIQWFFDLEVYLNILLSRLNLTHYWLFLPPSSSFILPRAFSADGRKIHGRLFPVHWPLGYSATHVGNQYFAGHSSQEYNLIFNYKTIKQLIDNAAAIFLAKKSRNYSKTGYFTKPLRLICPFTLLCKININEMM